MLRDGLVPLPVNIYKVHAETESNILEDGTELNNTSSFQF